LGFLFLKKNLKRQFQKVFLKQKAPQAAQQLGLKA